MSTLRTVFRVLILTLAGSALAQPSEPPPVADLTDAPPTADQLIELLKSRAQAPEALRTRGLASGAGPTAPRRASCATAQGTRGLTSSPARVAEGSRPVALHIHFASGSADLHAEARETLGTVAEALSSPDLVGACIEIQGHTDDVGPDELNDELSLRRADAVREFLVSQGLDRERLIAVGFGERSPIAENETAEGRGKNRRVQIANLGAGEP